MTKRLACIVMITSAVLLAIINSPVFIMYEFVTLPKSDKRFCMADITRYKTYAFNVMPWIDLTLYTILPSFIIVNSNIVIVYTLSRNRMKSQVTAKGETALQKSFNKIIPMLLLVSTTYVVCTFPVCVYIVGK